MMRGRKWCGDLRVGRWKRITVLVVWIAITKSVQDHFHPSRHSELVEDAEHVVLDRMFAKVQARSNFSIAQTLADAAHHVQFPLGQQCRALGIGELLWDRPH